MLVGRVEDRGPHEDIIHRRRLRPCVSRTPQASHSYDHQSRTLTRNSAQFDVRLLRVSPRYEIGFSVLTSSRSARNAVQQQPEPVSEDDYEDFNIFNSDGEEDADVLQYDVLESFEA
jgi:hypothetical protein